MKNRNRPSGQAIVEFAFALPVLLTLLIASITVAVAFNNELDLSYATNAATQLLSISRGPATTDPCALAVSTVETAAPSLTPGSLGFTLILNGSSTFTGTSCTSATLVEGQTVELKVTYPCNLYIYGVNYAPSCSLTGQTTAYIQ